MDLLTLGALDMVVSEDGRRRGCGARDNRGARRSAPAALLVAFCTLLATWSGDALAGDKAMAESLFLAGKKLMEQGKVDQACPKFAESMRIEPAVGALLNLALCHERQGKTASAWAEYKQAATMAKAEGQRDRVEGALELASKLEPTLSRLTIEAPTPRPATKVRRGGQEIGEGALGVAVAVDPGDYTIEASAPGYARWSTTVVVGPDGGHQTVVVPLLQPAEAPDDGDEGGGTLRYGLAAATTGVSLVGLVLGSVFGTQAMSKWDDAQAQCDEVPTYCSKEAVELGEEANDAATVSTVGFVIGAAALVGAVVLWITAPGDPAEPESGDDSTALRVEPMVSHQTAGLWLGGSF